MKKGLWIRLDVPYAEDADRMRAVLAFREAGGTGSMDFLEMKDCPDIPHAMNGLYDQAAKAGITIDSSLTLVFPLDDRHSIAWPAKEDADKRGIQFARHIPDIKGLSSEIATAYENFDTGSAEEALPPTEAQSLVMALNRDARETYSAGNLLEAMGPLRHALWLSLRHFGWGSPGTLYTLRNLGYTLYATGNDENRAEVEYLTARMLHDWKQHPIHADAWREAESVLESFAELCDAIGAKDYASLIRAEAEKITTETQSPDEKG